MRENSITFSFKYHISSYIFRNYVSISTTQLTVILLCLKTISGTAAYIKYIIFSDSLISRRSHTNVFSKYSILQGILLIINPHLSKNFIFIWIPNHTRTKVNDFVDRVAKQATSKPTIT